MTGEHITQIFAETAAPLLAIHCPRGRFCTLAQVDVEAVFTPEDSTTSFAVSAECEGDCGYDLPGASREVAYSEVRLELLRVAQQNDYIPYDMQE